MFKKFALAASMLAGIAPAYAQEMQAQTSYPYAYINNGNFRITWAYDAINLNAAKTVNATGKGVTVAVFDTGINPTNVKFAGNLVTGWNLYCNNGLGCSGVTKDNQWHGTFVSSIIGANMSDLGGQTMYGVAPDTKIMPIQILDSTGAGKFTDAQLAKAINYAVNNGAKVLNNSWNSSNTLSMLGSKATTIKFDYINELNAWKNAASKGNLIVFAAGNYALKDPGFYATMPTSVAGLNKNWITVVATDQTGALASYSNACGIAAAYCMAAPGSNIIGLYGTSIGIGSGTSYAAPIVSGAASLLFQYFPYLTGSDIQQILFTTADKSGIYANRAIYGQGMLDLTKAFQPVGTLKVATSGTVSGTSTPINYTYVAPSAAFGNDMIAALGATEVMLLDDYNRGYTINVGGGVVKQDPLMHWSDQMSMFGVQPVKTDDSTSMVGQYGDMPFSFSNVSVGDFDVSFGTNVSPSLSFGPFINDSINGSDLVLLNSVGNPYMNMAPDSSSSSMAYNWNERSSTRIGVFSNTINDDEIATLVDPSSIPRMSGATVEQTYKFDGGYISASVGYVSEENSVLGTFSSGALSIGESANTVFAGMNAGFDINETTSAFAGFNIGYTKAKADDGSMITDIESLTSGNAYLGLTKTSVMSDNDRFGLIAGLPMRVNTGVAHLKVPTSRDLEGNVTFNNTEVALDSDDFQFSLQGFYAAQIDDNQSVEVGIGALFNTADLENGTEVIGMARYNLNF